ncbi:MAG: hypothetical protein HOP12_05750 [Candidatus Eisenbacteria bacterium]|uniref:Glycosyl transferase family 28 C-terminal domain-containing protein n=1 Tax=Eiseniibacteriota bacterium TaxID=2212470 RepID=A0A849SQI2_UNCEI|nr:hypothetical protein [Candidatus Eisenbacteria bacterium]
MAPSWLLYSYDAMGLGHVRRALALARAGLAARPDLSALLVTCSPFAGQLPMPRGLDYIKMPSAAKFGNQHYVSRSLEIDEGHLHELRANLLREAVTGFKPQLMLVDKSPDGMAGELKYALKSAQVASRGTRLVLGWRDILDEPDAVQDEWRSRDTLRIIDEFYEEIWVWGDECWYDPRETYRMPSSIARRVRFMGYVSPPVGAAELESARARYPDGDGPRVLVTAGGGEDGSHVISRVLDSIASGAFPADARVLVVFGPYVPATTERRLRDCAPAGVKLETFVPGLAPLIGAADTIVGMAGYNTVSEALGSRVPMVLIPRVSPRREQWVRAKLLEHRGLAVCLAPDDLAPATVGAAVSRALERGRPSPDLLPRRDGLASAIRALDRLLPARDPSPPVGATARDRA